MGKKIITYDIETHNPCVEIPLLKLDDCLLPYPEVEDIYKTYEEVCDEYYSWIEWEEIEI